MVDTGGSVRDVCSLRVGRRGRCEGKRKGRQGEKEEVTDTES